MDLSKGYEASSMPAPALDLRRPSLGPSDRIVPSRAKRDATAAVRARSEELSVRQSVRGGAIEASQSIAPDT